MVIDKFIIGTPQTTNETKNPMPYCLGKDSSKIFDTGVGGLN